MTDKGGGSSQLYSNDKAARGDQTALRAYDGSICFSFPNHPRFSPTAILIAVIERAKAVFAAHLSNLGRRCIRATI